MASAIRNLFRIEARISGPQYLLTGLVLFAIKYCIDTTLSSLMLGRPWSMTDYFAPGAAVGMPVRGQNIAFFSAMLAVSIPFIAAGLILTYRRLKTAALPPWLIVFFFAPLVNFLFFAVISFHPSEDELILHKPTRMPQIPTAARAELPPTALEYARDQAGPARAFFGRIIPTQPKANLFVATIVPALVGVVITVLAVLLLRTYGWGLFVGLPFTIPMLAVLIRGYHKPLLKRQSLGIGSLAILAYAVGLMAVALEGAICIIMALPIGLAIGSLGAALGHAIQSSWHVNTAGAMLALLVSLPLIIEAERITLPPAPLFAVTTSVEIDAPPEKVWRNVISFRQLPPPTEPLFKLGIAYPIRAEIAGSGVGAVRHCVFSTGPFVEPITAWDEPRLLKFDVTDNPAPMDEWTPYDIDPPHLHNFMVSRGGQFHLIPLPGNRTRLEGTTWYHHHMWPAAYWRLWSDHIIHTIHLRVLNHVKDLSEEASPAALAIKENP